MRVYELWIIRLDKQFLHLKLFSGSSSGSQSIQCLKLVKVAMISESGIYCSLELGGNVGQGGTWFL